MKLMNLAYITLAAAASVGAVKTIVPLVAQNGTSVMAIGGSRSDGGTPIMSIKLPEKMTSRQAELLSFAYNVAKSDGFSEPKYLQGIILQESNAGNMGQFRVAGLTNAVGDRYFGIGQIKMVAAKAVMKRYPELWSYLDTRTDEELQARLIVDDKFNIRIASKYALLMGINKDPTFAITAYNRGPGGAKLVDPNTHHYTVKVRGHADRVTTLRHQTVN